MNERPFQRPDCQAIGARACEVGGLASFEGAKLGHCDQQGECGDVGYAGNAGQDGEAAGEAGVGFDNLENCRLDGRDLLDAAILAHIGALLELQARPARSEVLLELKEFYVAREALVKDRAAAWRSICPRR
jgi:hypothetical protein